MMFGSQPGANNCVTHRQAVMPAAVISVRYPYINTLGGGVLIQINGFRDFDRDDRKTYGTGLGYHGRSTIISDPVK